MAKKKVTQEMDQITLIHPDRPHNPDLPKNHYFDNSYVESLLKEYVWGGCTDVKLRDKIMENASELIRQIIRTHKMHLLIGREGTSFGDLYQIAWVQIESSLYKFDSRPGHTKVFNMWSQVAKTVMLAHIKKESRDKRNYDAYKGHLDLKGRPINYKFNRFIKEAEEIFKYDDEGLELIRAMEHLAATDSKPYDGLIDKLSKHSKLSRSKVSNLLRAIRLRSFEFSDSPVNNQPVIPENKYRISHHNYESDDD